MTQPTDIIGIGAALVDILATCDEAFLLRHNLTKGHMHLIDDDRAAALDGAVEGAKIVSGGSAANTCLGVASFGGSASFIGSVANDYLGEVFAGDMKSAGLSFNNIAGAAAASTGRCYCFITPDGERTMCTYLGASGAFAPGAVTPAMVTSAAMLYVEGYIWDTPERVGNVDAAITAMKAAQRKVAFTLSDAWCAAGYREIFMGYLNARKVDVLFANEAEILALTEQQDFDNAVAIARTLAPVVVVTRSEKGAVILNGEDTVTVGAEKIEKLVDATGAGDLFAAGFLYGYLRGATLAQAGQLGAMAAAEVISHIGARPQVNLADYASSLGIGQAA